MSKQIILDCERMKYPYTGLYHFCKELGEALIRQNRNNEITFYVPEKVNGIFGEDQKYLIQSHLHKFFPKNTSQFDVWHCTYQGSNYFPSKRMGLRSIVTIHDLNFLHEGRSEKKQNKYHRKAQQAINNADEIVAISNFVKNDILNTLDVGSKNIHVIYNGCNKPISDNFQKPEGAYNKPFFFSIGTITDKKNFHVLAAMLIDNDYELVIAGITQNQNYHNKIIDEAKNLGVENRVKLIGAVTESEKYWLYKNCAAFCFPSLAEGFGLPVIEAMQFGTPVILSKATSLPEIGGPHAIYFEGLEPELVSKAATEFLNRKINDTERQELINWAKQFDWDVSARKYLELYEKLN